MEATEIPLWLGGSPVGGFPFELVPIEAMNDLGEVASERGKPDETLFGFSFDVAATCDPVWSKPDGNPRGPLRGFA